MTRLALCLLACWLALEAAVTLLLGSAAVGLLARDLHALAAILHP